MAKLYNLARMTTATTGTGTVTLGAAVSGYLTFALAGAADGETVSYGINDGVHGEVGTGVYSSAGPTLTRTVTRSTNSNNAISLSGAAEVFITARKEDFIESNLTVADGATITWDLLNSRLGTVTLAGNRTMAAPINAVPGSMVLIVKQDATGGRTLTWNAVFKWPGGVAPTLSTAANATDVLSFVHDGTNFYGTYMNGVA